MATTTTEPADIFGDSNQFIDDEVQRSSGGTRRWAILAIIAAAIIGGGSYAAMQSGESSNQRIITDESQFFEVKSTDLIVTVTEDGNVESANNIDVKCTVAGGSTILWLVDDGTEVKKGDKLVELDAAALEDQINTQKIAYNKAKAAVVQADKNFVVAKLAVREYLEGTYKQELETAEAQVTIAEENLRSAKNSLEYSQRMFQRGYISQLELESQEFTVKRAELELSAAQTAKNVLIQFTKVKTLEELESQVETAESTLESERAAYELEDDKLRRLQSQLESCTIVAPQDGMVVYANEQGGRFGQQTATIEEGAAVRDRQTILRLPDLARMQVKVNVHETKVEQISIGMRALIKIQGRQYQGAVTAIANQHEPGSFFSGNVKEYATTVRIAGEVESLRPGMTAEVEILISHLKNVLTIPVSAVVQQRNEYWCWVVAADGTYERRAVKLGLSDDNYVQALDGLKERERVIRNPRALVEEAKITSADMEGTDDANQFGDAAEMPPAGSGSGGPGMPAAGPGGRGPGGPGMGGPGPEGAAPGGSGPGGSGPGGPAAGRSGRGGGGSRPDLMSFDTDGDGKVSKDEAPEPMRDFFDRMDGNSDGFIDKAESDALRRRFEQGGGESGGGPGAGGPPATRP